MPDPFFDIHYITKVVNRRQPIFALDPRFAQYVIENLEFYRNKFGFRLYGFVIMPDHIHDIIDTCGKTAIQKIFEDMDKYIARQVLSDLKS
ncbi:MAG TPA: transposase [bacterium]